MQPNIKVFLCTDDGRRFFGEGPYALLKGIEKTHSLRAASQQMGMAYTKALELMRGAENALGTALTTKTIGGKGGGGSQLTAAAKELMMRYEQYETACSEANSRLFATFFGSFTPSSFDSDGQ